MGISAALDALNEIQAGLAITSPIVESIKRVYKYMPNQSESINDCPCFVNTWTLLPVLRMPSLRETEYDVRMWLVVKDMNQSRAADIATAFMDQILTVFDTNLTLGGTVSHHDLMGGTPTLIGFDWAGGPYVGLDLHLHMYLKDFVTFEG